METLSKSCLIELVGACLDRSGSTLQVKFLQNLCVHTDIMIMTLKYVKNQNFKASTLHELLT